MKFCLALIFTYLPTAINPAVVVPGAESVEELCRRAQELLAEGKYQQAREAAEHAFENDRGSVEAASPALRLAPASQSRANGGITETLKVGDAARGPSGGGFPGWVVTSQEKGYNYAGGYSQDQKRTR